LNRGNINGLVEAIFDFMARRNCSFCSLFYHPNISLLGLFYLSIVFYLDPLLRCEDVHNVLSGEVTQIDNVFTLLHHALESALVLSYYRYIPLASHIPIMFVI
jgi:hypothetical protein